MASEFILIFLLNYFKVIIYYVANEEKSIANILYTAGKSKNQQKQLKILSIASTIISIITLGITITGINLSLVTSHNP